MTDNVQERGPQDRSRVNLSQEHEVRYWVKRFGCTEAELREAVRKVGAAADAVERAVQH